MNDWVGWVILLWFEFDSDWKYRHVKHLIQEKYSHTIITEATDYGA